MKSRATYRRKMQYRQVPKNGDRLSALGFGAMRLVKKRGRIDEERATKQIRDAIDSGINYIDTAAPYHRGESERLLGRALLDGYREKVKLATKLTPGSVRNREDMDRILDIQLKKLQTDHIDYYLLHSLDAGSWSYLYDLGVLEFLDSAKAAKKIINAGFSFHGDRQTFRDIIDAYDWIFCQIQYNILDEENQAGTEGLIYAASKHIAVMVMEPLRGGMLARNIPREVEKIYAGAQTRRSAAAWNLRWIWNHPEVTVVLSGMNHERQIEENIRTCEDALPGCLSPDEEILIKKVQNSYRHLIPVGCTGCAYCMPCPFGVNIPGCLSSYNEYVMLPGKLMTRIMYGARILGAMGKPSNASLCRNCGKCVSTCPQHIDIPKELRNVSHTLDGFRTRVFIPLIRLLFPNKVKDE